MKKYILILLITLLGSGICGSGIFVFGSSPAFSDSLNMAAPHGGGSLTLKDPASQYQLWDLKGQPLAGTVTDGKTIVNFGWIYASGAAGNVGPVDVPLADNGLINSTVIERVADAPGSDIRIKFRAKDNTVGTASIFRLAGDGAGVEFSNDTKLWQLIAKDLPVAPNVDTVWTEPAAKNQIKVGDGKNAYYRVVPTVVAQADIFGSDKAGTPYNARSVGKVDSIVSGVAKGAAKPYKYSFLSHPFIYDNPDPNIVLGSQLVASSSQANATELWGWTGVTFGMQEYLSDKGWVSIGNNQPVQFTNGASVVLKTKEGMPDKQISLVGQVRGTEFGPVKVGNNLYTFIGQPHPKSIDLSAANLLAANGAFAGDASGLADQLWGWTGDTFGEQMYLDKKAGWTVIPGFNKIVQLSLGKGYIYRRYPQAAAGGLDWKFAP